MLADGTVYPTFSGQSSLLTSLEAAASSLLSEFDQSSVTNNDDVASSLLSELASLTSEASFIQTASSAGFLGGGGGAATTFNSGSSPSSLSTSSNTQSQSQSLAPGIIAAIAVPSAVGAIALAGFIVWLVFYLRRRNRRRRAWQNPMVGPYTQGGQQPPISTYPDTYAVNKDFASPTTVRQLSPSNPSMSVVSPYPSSPGAGELNGAHGPQSAGYHSPGLNRENLDALSATSPSGGGNPRGSDELARGRRLSDDGTTAIPEASVAGRTNWTADSFNVMGGRR
ncbi:hypothetical protein MMC10_003913 [Thelotrema lepadinum]|nr:hypothetical protein [Thelotrema lepadinum]